MTVLLGCRDLGRAKAAAGQLAQEGLAAVPILLDVTRPETIWSAASEIGSKHGKLDVLVNNAGIALEWQSKPSQVDLAVVRQVL